jgi:hypothetical protein
MDVHLLSVLLTHEIADRFFNAQKNAEIITSVVIRFVVGIAIGASFIIIISPSS